MSTFTCAVVDFIWPQSANPASYLSHLPVHMDGSCNGLQHYAALGRDEIGGKAVNLMPSDKPQDVYKVRTHVLYQISGRCLSPYDGWLRTMNNPNDAVSVRNFQ